MAYMIFGSLWILLSDKLIFSIFNSSDAIEFIGIIKGWCFVAISGLLIYYLSRRAFIQHEAVATEKLAAHRSTISGVQHILRNYLNQMQLVTLEAEKCDDFDPELLQLSKELSSETSEELEKLEKFEDVRAEAIQTFIYRNLKTDSP